MGTNSSVMLQDEEIKDIQMETGCENDNILFTTMCVENVQFVVSKNQIVRLYNRFTSLDKSVSGSLG